MCPTWFYFVLSEVFQEIMKFSNEDFAHAFVRLGLDGYQNNAKPVNAGFLNLADVRLLERRCPTTVDLQFLMGRKSVPFADSLLWPFELPRRPKVNLGLPSSSSSAGARLKATSQDHSELPWVANTQQTQDDDAAESQEPAVKK